MVDFYKILGVSEEATPAEIKAAYRRQAFALHPDTNPDGAGSAGRAHFAELQEAYTVLRDEGKRAQYDRMRAVGFGGPGFGDATDGAGRYSSPWGEPRMGGQDFDAAFDEWWKKMSQEFDSYEKRQYMRERSNAERMARTAAWEWEKREAQATKVRAQKLKWRVEDARLQRHATTLRRFWQTHSGLTLGDAIVAGLCLAGTAGIALAWRTHIREAREEQQAKQQQQQRVKDEPAAVPASASAAAAAVPS